MKRFYRFIIILSLGVIAAAAVVIALKWPRGTERIEIAPARIADIKELARLCAIDIYTEMPVLDTVNNKVMFAVQKQTGSISFDMENLNPDDSGDTVRVTLPPEIVELYEATSRNAWEVIDTKAIGPMAMLRSDKFSLQEENVVKSRVRQKSIKQLYTNGTVHRAREEGAIELKRLLEMAYRKPVVVTDPTPDGAHYHQATTPGRRSTRPSHT